MTVSMMVSDRRGILLPIILVLIAGLSLAVSIFAEHMLAEYRVTHSLATQLVAGAAADSGVQYALATTRVGQDSGSDRRWKTQTIAQSSSAFIVVKDRLQIETPITEHRGLANESGKLNLNGLPTGIDDMVMVRQRLMQLPRMTPQIADAIMDWIDADSQPRPLGAEASWYSAQNAARLPAQRPLYDLSEMLLIRGVTPELLYGEDANGNGWLDANEDDGPATLPADNADGVLSRGWSAYLTVVSAESNLRPRKLRKVNLNQPDLVKLYDQLLPELGQDATMFVVALRLDGPRQKGTVEQDSTQVATDERVRTAPARLKSQLDQRSKNQSAKTAKERGGMDLSAEPAFTFKSLVDLIDQEVLTIVNGQQTLLKSPWETSQLESALEKLEEVCTTQERDANLSRINLAYASTTVLKTIPNLDGNKAAAIVSRAARYRSSRSIGWLVSEGLMTLEQLRDVAPFMTAGGDVWSGTSVGWSIGQPTGVARHFVIDVSPDHERIVSQQDSLPLNLKNLKGLVP